MHFQGWRSSHKWLSSPNGSAFLRARGETQPVVEPLFVSWGWQSETTTLLSLDGDGAAPFILQHEWQGTRDIAANWTVPAAIQFKAEHDWGRVRAECHELVRFARQAIGELTGLEQICPDSAEWPKDQMATIPLSPCDAGELKRRLAGRDRSGGGCESSQQPPPPGSAAASC